jgi:hypothetical protein
MTKPASVYHSRSRAVRNRLLLGAAGLALLLTGYGLGRLQGSAPDAVAAPLPVSSSPSAPAAAAPSPSAAPASSEPVPQGGTDAYTPIQAESAAAVQGIEMQDTEDQGGGKNAGWISNGDWLRYNDINFGAGPATEFAARVASDIGGGKTGRMELRLDDPASTPIGTMTVGNLGGWQNWQNQVTTITPVKGKHTLYLTFASDSDDDFLNLNFFAFGH